LDRYTSPVASDGWDVPAHGTARFTWQYDDGRARLLSLYQKGKDKQWDATLRISWDLEVDPNNVMGLPERFNPLLGSDIWEKMSDEQRVDYRRHNDAWVFSQFLHGEQGALTVAARIVEAVPDLDSKFYAATQVMDEARHVELFARFVKEKIGLYYPMNPGLATLLEESLTDPRWDMPYLGMQILIEGLALATFGIYRDLAGNPLVKQLLAYVMQDEARHVAFGRLSLRDYYNNLSDSERAEREEFVVQGCLLMRERFQAREVFETLGLPVAECVDYVLKSPVYQTYQTMIFSRIVPCVRDIGLWGERVQKAYADMGVLDAVDNDLEALMRNDEEIAEEYDVERERQALESRKAEVRDAIALGQQE
jgi:hypothetical protein